MSVSIITGTPVCDSEDFFCYLLEIDDYKILLDCGWNDEFDLNLISKLESICPDIDAVLISFPDIRHLGAIGYAVGKLGLNCPIYSTMPVSKMGQMFMYDSYAAKTSVEHFDEFTLDDVDAAFEKFVQLKYSQHFRLEGKGKGIVVTPYSAGHMIGGTIWKITKETEEIVYAVDYNHRKERHLNGTILETLSRPTLLITDAVNALNTQPSRSSRDLNFFNLILDTLRNNGNVLLPSDSAGRILELSLCLDQHWSWKKGLSKK